MVMDRSGLVPASCKVNVTTRVASFLTPFHASFTLRVSVRTDLAISFMWHGTSRLSVLLAQVDEAKLE